MNYKTELHCHSASVSACADISPADIVAQYLEKGYSSIVLTEHLSPATFAEGNYSGGDDWSQKVDFFLSGYRALRDAAGDRLHVLLGAEIRVDSHSGTDFLVYGLTEEILYSLTDLLNDKPRVLSERLRAAGCLFCQAHPFRNNMKIVNPALLDGIEVFNGNPSHDSRNAFAAMWAEQHSLIPLSGSDLHHPHYPINGGILTDRPIETNEQLLAILRSGSYTLIDRA